MLKNNITTFKRVEQKYLLNKEQKDLFLNSINKYIEKDEYYESTIYNIYFDTPNKDLIINSLEKPIYKDKVRLRSYNIPTLEDNIFLEIKNKYKGVVGKRRIKLKLKDYYNYIENNIYDNNNQIMKEIDYLFKYYNLKPSIFIAYDRKSYKAEENENLRITIDTNLRSRYNNLKLDFISNEDKYFNKDKEYYIMEIKTINSIPLWLVNSLSKLKLYPVSFSKYGKIFTKIREEDVKC